MNSLNPNLYFARGYASHGPAAATPTFGTDLQKLKPSKDRPNLMFVLAHPDDEVLVSGTAAILNRNGFNIQLVYLTDGDAGRDVSPLNRKGQELAKARCVENGEALKLLGIDTPPVYLKFPDGHVKKHASAIRAALVEQVRAFNPAAVITFGPDGITNHDDHKCTSRITDQAVAESGLDSRLYHIALSERSMDVFKQAFERSESAI